MFADILENNGTLHAKVFFVFFFSFKCDSMQTLFKCLRIQAMKTVATTVPEILCLLSFSSWLPTLDLAFPLSAVVDGEGAISDVGVFSSRHLFIELSAHSVICQHFRDDVISQEHVPFCLFKWLISLCYCTTCWKEKMTLTGKIQEWYNIAPVFSHCTMI